jgi:hypothetical protein
MGVRTTSRSSQLVDRWPVTGRGGGGTSRSLRKQVEENSKIQKTRRPLAGDGHGGAHHLAHHGLRAPHKEDLTAHGAPLTPHRRLQWVGGDDDDNDDDDEEEEEEEEGDDDENYDDGGDDDEADYWT